MFEAKGLIINEMAYGATISYVGATLGMFVGSWIIDINRHRKIIIVSGLFSTTALLSILPLLQIQTSFVALILQFCVFFVIQMASPIFGGSSFNFST